MINTANKGSTIYRNAPDVSANANFTFYVCADQTTCTANDYGGTSFAAPMWAGYLALTNQQAAANGDPAPGFINPAIYPLGLGQAMTPTSTTSPAAVTAFPRSLATIWRPDGAVRTAPA